MSAPISPSTQEPTVIELKAAHLTLGKASAAVKILKGVDLQISAF